MIVLQAAKSFVMREREPAQPPPIVAEEEVIPNCCVEPNIDKMPYHYYSCYRLIIISRIIIQHTKCSTAQNYQHKASASVGAT